ncbi:MAG: DUF91 domain-containing protein [Pseudomonadota bacterium]|nr:DUF91 domain-containing protein [Pseudomonadota bacterium]
MSDSKLFSLQGGQVQELTGSVATLERNLQLQIESSMPAFLGAQFLATEYSTGKTHRVRIDSLGLDENNCPVIIEYKRSKHQNVINQGLFYLDWLLDHKAEFQWLVMEKLGKEKAETIEWGGTRLICIAADFTQYDEHAVQQINRNIELMRYRYFGSDLLLLELVNVQSAVPASLPSTKVVVEKEDSTDSKSDGKSSSKDKSQQERLAEASPELLALYEDICNYTKELGHRGSGTNGARGRRSRKSQRIDLSELRTQLTCHF